MKKPRKSIVASTTLTPYCVDLDIIFTDDLVGVATELNVSNAESVAGRAGFACDSDGKFYIAFDYAGLNASSVAHESNHTVYAVFRFVGQPLDGGEEAACYLLGHIVECINVAAKKKRISIKPI